MGKTFQLLFQFDFQSKIIIFLSPTTVPFRESLGNEPTAGYGPWNLTAAAKMLNKPHFDLNKMMTTTATMTRRRMKEEERKFWLLENEFTTSLRRYQNCCQCKCYVFYYFLDDTTHIKTLTKKVLAGVSPLGQTFKSLGYFWYGSIRIWQTFAPTFAIFYATGQIFIVINGQRLKTNLAIWSHWSLVLP